MSTYNPSAYIVVFAVDDESTLDQADRILAYLRMSGVMETTAVILVANKTDLVRSRSVATQGEATTQPWTYGIMALWHGSNNDSFLHFLFRREGLGQEIQHKIYRNVARYF